MEKKKADLILKNCYLISMDEERHIYEDGAVAIVDGKIAGYGRQADVISQFYADETYDCEGGIVGKQRNSLPTLMNVKTVRKNLEFSILFQKVHQDLKKAIVLILIKNWI